MKTIKLTSTYLLIALFTVLLYSCDLKNKEPEKPANQYLVSSSLKASISAPQATQVFTKLSQQDPSFISFLIKSDVEVRSVIYKTTFKNQKIMASGLICTPTAAGDYPIMSFQNGTNTLQSLAPSVSTDNDLYAIIQSVAAMGFIVVVPDYIGFGVSAQLPHPYLHAESTVASVLDLIRAAREYGADDKVLAKPTNDLFIFGYSQGGWATLAVQKEIETNYSSEFHLIASSCGAGPYSIEFMNNRILSQPEYPTPYFLAYLLNSYHEIGEISNPLTDFFNEPYAARIPGLFDGMHEGGSINAELTSNLSTLLTADYRTQYESSDKFAGLRLAFKANSVAPWKISTPTHLYHGDMDQVIPLGMSQQMFADLKTKGATDELLQLKIIEGADHTSGVYQTGLETIMWFLQIKP